MPEILELINVAAQDFRTAPMPRHKVTKALWEQAAGDTARGLLTLLSLWATRGAVHMALLNGETRKIGVLSLENRRAGFPSVGRYVAPAQRLERAIGDLFGMSAQNATDARPWLDHGKWTLGHPMGREADATAADPYAFLPVEGEGLHRVPVGPVHAGIIEPGQFLFTAQGETVVRLEERLGFTHKGVDRLMKGATTARGAELAGRVSGDSTIAYGWAYAQAIEAALETPAPPRAEMLRAIMAEVERLANHLNDVGAICNDAAFAMMLAQFGALRERVMRAANAAFGHRFMRDCIVPGGVSRDLNDAHAAALRAMLADIKQALPPLVHLYDHTASLLDRTVGTGTLSGDLARCFGAGGFVGRASGRDFDTRKALPYGPYDALSFNVPTRREGDVNARIWVRLDEIRESLSLLEQMLKALPDGPVFTPLADAGEKREGLGLVEGFRGDVLIWVLLDARGRIARCHMRDPSWFQWPLLEAVIEGNIIADFPLCNKSFNCSYSGVDL